jgi:phenylacetate-CoA ligase
MKNLAGRLKRTATGDTLVRRNPLLYGRMVALVERLDQASLEQRRSFTEGRLRRILDIAGRTRYGRPYAGKSLSDWPLLDRQLVRDDPMAFVHGPTWLGFSATTTGTSGMPLKLWRSLRNVVNEQVRIDWLFRRSGVDPTTARVAVLRGDDIKDPSDREPPFWKKANAGRRLIFSSNHLSRDTIRHFHETLAQYAPHCLAAYPTALETLCELLRQESLPLNIPLVVTSSEVLPVGTWHLAREVLGATVVDYYGQAERVAFAAAFEPEVYRFMPGYACVELLPAGEDEDHSLFEIVGTNLWNTKMPLVRYRTGDLIRLPKTLLPGELEAICYGCMPFLGILGRHGDYLIAPNGTRITGIDHIPRGVAHIIRSQVVQESLTDVRILVVPGPGFSDAQIQQLLANAAIKLPPEMSVRVEAVEQLIKGKQSKVPFVVRRVEVSQASPLAQ